MTAHAAPSLDLPVPPSAIPLSTTQIDGVAWEQVVSGDVVYVGGSFTAARPAGAQPGTQTVPRANMLAYNINTGKLINSFVADTDGQVLSMAMAPDGSRLYIGGEFTKVNGITRYRLAALDPATGAVDTTFNAGTGSKIRAIVVTGDTVYVGGRFDTAITGPSTQPRMNMAAFRRSDGAVLNWAPEASNGQVYAMAQVPGSGRITVGGSFNKLNGIAALGLGSVDAATGATLSYPANEVIKNGTDGVSAILSLRADSSKVYGTGYTFGDTGGLGNFEGQFAADAAGNIVWINDSRGDQYDTFSVRGITLSAGHAHRSANLENGFQELNVTTPTTQWPAIATTSDATGVLAPATVSYNFGGKPAPTMLHWWPKLDPGTFTGQGQAAWTIEGNNRYVVLGGEFPSAGGIAQQGLVRYAFRDVDPNTIRPVSSGSNFKPDVSSPASGVAQISWAANWDRDDQLLNYTVERKLASGTAAIGTYQVWSNYYERPVTTHLDKGLPVGSTQNYRVVARDSSGNVATGDWVPITVNGSGPLSSYAATVLADAPSIQYRFEESSGTVIDSAYTTDGVATSGVTRRVAGAISGESGKGYGFNGSGGGAASSTKQFNPRAMTTEAWVRTTSTQGGLIIGFGSSISGSSATVDYATYLGNDGKIRFVVDERGKKSLVSPASYNDGDWHHVVSTLDWWSGQRLYIDGKLVASDPGTRHAKDFTGYWRIGGDSLTGLPNLPTSNYLKGDIDEVAVYSAALPEARVSAHFTVGKGGQVTNQPPVASFTAASDGLLATVNGTASVDPDGSIASYDWNFGDGYTTTGATASHSYATAGTYLVTLTVTDNAGAKATKSTPVTVVAPTGSATLVSDNFNRVVSSGWGSAQSGGAWTATGGLSNFAVNGSEGVVTVLPGTTRRATTAGTGGSVELNTVVSLSAVPTGGGVYLQLGTRAANGNAYTTRLRFYADGKVGLHNQRVMSGAETVTFGGLDLPGVTSAAGDKWHVRASVTGSGTTTISAKAWKAGTPEPAGWAVVSTDSTAALQGSGAFYIEPFLSGSATSPVAVRVDDFSVRSVGSGSANQAPTASFTSATNGLQVSVNGSASSDPDGSIASYAWSFGDGGTASGATAARTYASPGTYPVTLTVTDNAGATATKTSAVTVSGSTTGALLADDFNRSVAPGWGTAATGGAWTATGGLSNFSVTGSEASVALAPGTTRRATSAATGSNVEVTTVVAPSTVPTGGGLYLNLGTRSSGSAAYVTRLRLYADGKVSVHHLRSLAGATTAIAGKELPFTYAAGDRFNVKYRVSGSGTTTLSAKVWKVGATEPANWDLVTTDATAGLSGTGAIFVEGYLSASATAPVEVRLDEITANPLG